MLNHPVNDSRAQQSVSGCACCARQYWRGCAHKLDEFGIRWSHLHWEARKLVLPDLHRKHVCHRNTRDTLTHVVHKTSARASWLLVTVCAIPVRQPRVKGTSHMPVVHSEALQAFRMHHQPNTRHRAANVHARRDRTLSHDAHLMHADFEDRVEVDMLLDVRPSVVRNWYHAMVFVPDVDHDTVHVVHRVHSAAQYLTFAQL